MQEPSLFAKLLQGAGAALIVKLVSAGVLYISQVLLARWMGTAEYGIYGYATAVSILGAFLAGFGLPTVVLRFIPAYETQGDWAHLAGLIWGSWRQTLIIGVIVSCCGTAILLRLDAVYSLGTYTIPLIIGVWTIPIAALVNLQREIIRGFRQIVLSYGPSLILQPVLLVGMATLWQLRQGLNSLSAIALSLVSMVLALAFQGLLFGQTLDPRVRNVSPAYEIPLWWRTALPLILLDSSHMVLSQTDTLMIGVLLDARQVGIYNAALETSSWVPFILMSVNAIAAPLFASLYARGDREGLQQLVSTVARWMFYPALASAIGLIGFAEFVLQLFGSEFIAAENALRILILGQLVNVGAGSVGYLMTMTGHQVQSARVMGASALMNVILNLIGIHLFGIAGAALATALSMAMWNIWLHALVVRKIGVRPSILETLG